MTSTTPSQPRPDQASPPDAPPPPPAGLPPLLTIQVVASYLGRSERTIRRYLSSGILPHAKVGGRIHIRVEDVERVIRPVAAPDQAPDGLADFVKQQTHGDRN